MRRSEDPELTLQTIQIKTIKKGNQLFLFNIQTEKRSNLIGSLDSLTHNASLLAAQSAQECAV